MANSSGYGEHIHWQERLGDDRKGECTQVTLTPSRKAEESARSMATLTSSRETAEWIDYAVSSDDYAASSDWGNNYERVWVWKDSEQQGRCRSNQGSEAI